MYCACLHKTLGAAACHRGKYTFTQDSFEAGDKVVAASITAANLTAEKSVVPRLVVAVVHTPKLAMRTSESNCTLHFKGKRARRCLCVALAPV